MYPPLSSYPSATDTGHVAFSDAPSQPEHGAPAPGLTQLLDRVVAAQSSDDVIVALSELSVNPELLYVVVNRGRGAVGDCMCRCVPMEASYLRAQ